MIVQYVDGKAVQVKQWQDVGVVPYALHRAQLAAAWLAWRLRTGG